MRCISEMGTGGPHVWVVWANGNANHPFLDGETGCNTHRLPSILVCSHHEAQQMAML